MSRLADYLTFAKTHPDLFVSPVQDGFTILLNEEEIHKAESKEAEKLISQGMPAEWAQVGIAYRDQYLLILRDAVRFPDGSLATCIRAVDEGESVPGVVILPVYQGKILLIRHFRHELRNWHLEIPQGFGMPGLSSEECAQRELEEEIGATVFRMTSLGQAHPDTSSGSNRLALFYADVATYGKVESQEGIVELLPTPISEVERMIREHELTSMTLLVTYTRAKLLGLI